MQFININPFFTHTEMEGSKICVIYKSQRWHFEKHKRPCLGNRAWFSPLRTSNFWLYALKHSVANKMEILLWISFRSLLSEFSSQAPTRGLVGLLGILAQINSKKLQLIEEPIPKAQLSSNWSYWKPKSMCDPIWSWSYFPCKSRTSWGQMAVVCANEGEQGKVLRWLSEVMSCWASCKVTQGTRVGWP